MPTSDTDTQTEVTLAQEFFADLPAPLAGEFTPTAWIAPLDITYDEWYQVGDGLSLAGKAIHWWCGDWILAGESNKQWGDKYTQAVDETRFSLQTLKNDAWVAERIPPPHRRIELSWTHHYYVASLELPEIDAILDKAIRRKWRTRKLYQLIQRWRRIYRPDTIRHVGASKWSKSNLTSMLPLPPTIDATPENEDRTVWTADRPDTVYVDWRRVAKAEWRRKRHFERMCDDLLEENAQLREENAELMSEIAKQAIIRSPVRSLNWSD